MFFWVIFKNLSPPTFFDQFIFFFFLVHNMAKYIEKKSYLSLLLTSNPFFGRFFRFFVNKLIFSDFFHIFGNWVGC